MYRIITLVALIFWLTSNAVAQNTEKYKSCNTSLRHKVNPVGLCKSSTSTSVVITFEVGSCPQIKTGVSIVLEYLNNNNHWRHVETLEINQGGGIATYKGTGLLTRTNQKYRYWAYPTGTEVEIANIPEKHFKEYPIYIEHICK